MQRIKRSQEYIQQFKEMFREPPSAIGISLTLIKEHAALKLLSSRGKKNEYMIKTIPTGKTHRLLSSSPYGFDLDIGY